MFQHCAVSGQEGKKQRRGGGEGGGVQPASHQSTQHLGGCVHLDDITWWNELRYLYFTCKSAFRDHASEDQGKGLRCSHNSPLLLV